MLRARMVRIVPIETPEDERLWRTEVEPRATSVAETLAWRSVLRDAYGIRGHLFAALENGACTGALGLYEIRHPLFGHYLTTAPFATDGGFFANTPAARARLLEAARRLADRRDVEYLLIRTREAPLEGFDVERRYVTAVVDLDEPPETIWTTRIPAKTRNQVRKGRKSGFTVRTGAEHVDAFFRVFHRHMRDLGSPAHGRRFYRRVLAELPDRTEVIVVETGEEVVAGALVFYVNQTAMNLHAVALRKYSRLCPNYLMYWTMLERSHRAGCRWFDMGRSLEDSPQLAFKQNWNPRVIPLSYNYYLRQRREVPFVDPRNPTYGAAISAWRRLPLWATRALGPRLIRGLA